jgi:hypothetical protein
MPHCPAKYCAYAFLALGITLAVSGRALAASGTDRIAEPGKPYSEQLAQQFEWPKGALELVNDPARTFGWNHWFSELPNDIMRFEYRIKDTAELNRLIEKLAAIDSKRGQIIFTLLDPPVHEKLSAAAEFAIGSQPQLDQWYKHLDPEKRKNVWKLTQVPQVGPPTLTIYVRHDAVNLRELAVPNKIDIEIMLTSRPQKGEKPTTLQKEMLRLVEEHEFRQKKVQ